MDDIENDQSHDGREQCRGGKVGGRFQSEPGEGMVASEPRHAGEDRREDERNDDHLQQAQKEIADERDDRTDGECPVTEGSGDQGAEGNAD